MANQYTGLDENEYAGWPNRSSWVIVLWRSNEEVWQEDYERIVDQVAGKVGPSLTRETGWNQVLTLYLEVWKAAAKEDGCIWKNVNWTRLKEHFVEDVEDAKR